MTVGLCCWGFDLRKRRTWSQEMVKVRERSPVSEKDGEPRYETPKKSQVS